MSFENFGLQAELVRAVVEMGYTQPTPIQSRGIPAVHRVFTTTGLDRRLRFADTPRRFRD